MSPSDQFDLSVPEPEQVYTNDDSFVIRQFIIVRVRMLSDIDDEEDDLECHYALVSVYQTQSLLNKGQLYL